MMKLAQQLLNLKFMADRKPAVGDDAKLAVDAINSAIANIEKLDIYSSNCVQQIMYFEAFAARNYWSLIGTKLPGPFCFAHRIKKGASDSFNPAINYLYGMLKNHVESCILGFGLDPSLACMHRDGYNLPSLVFDVMEPFRPVIDRLLLEQLLAGKLKAITADEDGTIRLTREGRKKLIDLFNEKLQKAMVYNNARTNLTNHIMLEIKTLANEIRNHES